MEIKILDKWTERHCTDSDYACGNYHYIDHTISLEDGEIYHTLERYEYDDWEGSWKLRTVESKKLYTI